MFSSKQPKKKSADNSPSSAPWDVVKVGKNGHSGHVCNTPGWNPNPEETLGKGSVIRCKECGQYNVCYHVSARMYWKPLSPRKVAKLTRQLT